ncbi:MAG: dethiobiotin synthase [Rhodoferax sp.]|nr:dethiobiotin synthase [Rhodoferax sp.]MDP3653284.1 dethiobiotin synthase [Rhodoferax sp.]
MKGFFVTGTDTGIGKTCVSAGLALVLGQAGFNTAAIKSLAAGQDFADGRWVNEDVALLRQASNLDLSDAEVCPLQLRTACAPHIAARLEGVAISREAILAAIRQVGGRADVSIVEGVGGFRVPLVPGWDTADLAVDLQLPVVLVVGMRLGCINHALLTAEALRARGLHLAGWVANTMDPDMPYLADNLAALADTTHGLQAPCWGLVPRLSPPTPAAVAAHLVQPLVLASFYAS